MHFGRTRHIIIILAALGAVCLSPALGQDMDSQEGQLKAIRQKLAEARERAQELKGQEKNILGQMERLAEQINLTRQVLEALRDKEARLNSEVRKLDGQMLKAESQMVRRQALMETRIRQMYKQGRLYEWEALVTRASFVDIVKRYKYLRLFSLQDRRLYETIREERTQISRDKADRQERLITLAQVRGETEREMANLKDDEQQQKRLLDKVRQEKASKEALVKELAAAAKKLQSLIDDLERQRKAELQRRKKTVPAPGATVLERKQGGLLWPAEGKLYSSFGLKKHAKYNTYIQNNGIDILSTYGSTVAAVAPGKVVYAERFLGYGNVILIDHDGGYYTLYGNLTDMLVFTGSAVAEGQVIARVGGNLDGPLMHFEVRKGGKPVDPVPWLKRKKGN
ncbi:peptidoglycan DD-metalloendopeptidase family protein [candidate division TA06 bacterium]|uniref:Peptidoglycan DD-metalloendopeptidase family protein n=1 Tax=candidate division TA06 bacterium TaxID=2250710 RepID=A0A933I8F1_UNCT6|nr:peptidoglycan DD-metalloendopeptidase family protein [candidate division TA06 bacterium]